MGLFLDLLFVGRFKMALLMFTLVLAFGGALSAPATTPAAPDFVTVLKGLGHYNSILELISAAGLTDTLLQAPDLTLFLPTDEAISKLPPATVQALQSDPQKLLDVLGYHAVVGRRFSVRGRKDDRTIMSYNNQTIRFNYYKTPNKSAVEGVEVVEKNIRTANGFVHGINGVMQPPAGNLVDIVAGRTDMNTLASLLTKTGLLDVIRSDQNITVFAPTDAAFANVNPKVLEYLTNHPDALQEVLLFHVVNRQTLYSLGMRHTMTFHSADKHHDNIVLIEDFRGNVYVDNAKVSEFDISGTNGVMHVIDDILIPARTVIDIEEAGINLAG